MNCLAKSVQRLQPKVTFPDQCQGNGGSGSAGRWEESSKMQVEQRFALPTRVGSRGKFQAKAPGFPADSRAKALAIATSSSQLKRPEAPSWPAPMLVRS